MDDADDENGESDGDGSEAPDASPDDGAEAAAEPADGA